MLHFEFTRFSWARERSLNSRTVDLSSLKTKTYAPSCPPIRFTFCTATLESCRAERNTFDLMAYSAGGTTCDRVKPGSAKLFKTIRYAELEFLKIDQKQQRKLEKINSTKQRLKESNLNFSKILYLYSYS